VLHNPGVPHIDAFLMYAEVGSTGQGNIFSTLALGVGNGANGTTWTITTPEEGIVAPMEGWTVVH